MRVAIVVTVATAQQLPQKQIPTPSGVRDVRTTALLLTDSKGGMRIQCLHGGARRPISTPAKALVESIFDASRLKDGLYIAANVERRAGAPGTLALLGPTGGWRRLDSGVRWAQFSADANSLAFEATALKHVGGGVMALESATKLIDLSSGALTTIGELSDPRWTVDGETILATRLDRQVDEAPRGFHVHAKVSRIRWDRRSSRISVLGQGDAQIPSPHPDAVAWRDSAQRLPLPAFPEGDRCALTVGIAGAAHAFPVEGPLCLGSADDRSVRFSPDGKWLAFSSFDGPAPTGNVPAGDGKSDPPMFLRIVSPSGGSHPAAEGLRERELEARSMAKRIDPVSMRRGYRWLDWSPSNTTIVAEGPDGSLSVFDLTQGTRTPAGKGRSPTFDERGEHILVLSPSGAKEEAFVIHREANDKRETLGHLRDARWVPAIACGQESESTQNGR